MMRSSIVIVFLAFLTCCTTPTSHDTKSNKNTCGVAHINNNHIDLGQIKYGDVVGAKCYLKNIGDAPLIIAEVKTDCGCTKAIYPNTPIAPTDSCAIEIMFDTSGLSGYQYKTTTIVTNSCEIQETKIAITAIIEY